MTIHSVFDIPGFLPLMERLNGKPLQDLRKSTNAGIVIQLGEHCLTITPGIHPDDGLPCKAILHSCSSSCKQIAPAESFSLLSSSLAGEHWSMSLTNLLMESVFTFGAARTPLLTMY